MTSVSQNHTHVIYARIFVAAFCFLALLGVVAPRSLSFLPALVGLSGFAYFRFTFGRWPKPVVPAFAWAIAIVALMLMSALWAVDPSHAFSRGGKTLPILLGGAMLLSLAFEAGDDVFALFRRFFPFVVIAVALLCNLALYFDAPFYNVVRGEPGIENLSALNRSIVIFSLIFFTGFALLPLKNILTAILALLTAAILYATHSQAAQLALLLGAVFYFFFPVNLKSVWIGLSAILVTAVLTTPFLAQFLYGMLSPVSRDFTLLSRSYAGQRLEIWDFISRRALENPLLGYGVEASRSMEFDAPNLYFRFDSVLHPHNFAVQVWLEFGALGAVVVSALFGFLLWSIYKSGPAASRICLPVLFATISVAATTYGLWQGWWLGAFMFLAALCVVTFKSVNTRA